jgi:N-acetyl-anhydromuramyl-L-alanine amidase AmpD
MRYVDKIIIHCSATSPSFDVDVEDVRGWHKARGWRDVGYHYFIKRDGTIQEGRHIGDIGAHARGYNNRSIGICYAGGVDEDNRPEDNRTDAQKESMITLIRQLKSTHGTIKEVFGHRDLAGVRKACPSFDAMKEFNEQPKED